MKKMNVEFSSQSLQDEGFPQPFVFLLKDHEQQDVTHTYTHYSCCEFTRPSSDCRILDLILWYSSLLKHVWCIEVNLKEEQRVKAQQWILLLFNCPPSDCVTATRLLKGLIPVCLCAFSVCSAINFMGHLIFPIADPLMPVLPLRVSPSHPSGTWTHLPQSSHRIIAAELHGTADDDDRDELPAYGAVAEQLPRPARLHSSDFRLFLQDLIELTAVDLAASQPPQSCQENITHQSAKTMTAIKPIRLRYIIQNNTNTKHFPNEKCIAKFWHPRFNQAKKKVK